MYGVISVTRDSKVYYFCDHQREKCTIFTPVIVSFMILFSWTHPFLPSLKKAGPVLRLSPE